MSGLDDLPRYSRICGQQLLLFFFILVYNSLAVEDLDFLVQHVGISYVYLVSNASTF